MIKTGSRKLFLSGYIVFILFLLGVIFRWWLIHLVTQPLVFDQLEYHNFAVHILQDGLFAWSARLYGYPLFLSFIYKLFGIGNLNAVAFFQSILDCLAGLLIYLSARRLFKNKAVATISYILYLFNPFTSAFASLALSEILTTFLFICIAYLLILFLVKKQKILIFILGFLLGYLPQVRLSFLFYSLLLVFFLIYKIAKTKSFTKKAGTILALIIVYLLPFTYNVAGNWVYFRQISPTTVDNLFVRELYISLYVTGPALPQSSDVYPKEVQDLYSEYSSKPKNEAERKAMTGKYMNLSLQKIKSDPGGFILSRIEKTWYVWEKHAIFLYNQPANSTVDFLTYWGNNLFLLLGALGIARWIKLKRPENLLEYQFVIIFSIIYISVLHSFSAADERYSLPGYPLIFLFAGYAIWNIIDRVIKSLNT